MKLYLKLRQKKIRRINCVNIPSIHNIFLMVLFDIDVEYHHNQIQLRDRIFQKVCVHYFEYIFASNLQIIIIKL
jgi:hypothetical protein